MRANRHARARVEDPEGLWESERDELKRLRKKKAVVEDHVDLEAAGHGSVDLLEEGENVGPGVPLAALREGPCRYRR